MSFGDRIRGFFSKKGNPAFPHLEAWAAEHKGVEGYIEPRTATNPTSLLLVDRYGEHIRGPARDEKDAVELCEKLGIPVYDARVMGYPQRMRDWDLKGKRSGDESLDETIADLEKRLNESEA